MTVHATPPPDPTAVVGRRIVAWSIDLAIFLAIWVGVVMASGGLTYETRTYSSARQATAACDAYRDDANRRFCSSVSNQASFLELKGTEQGVWPLHLLAYVVIQGIFAASIGKLIMGLRVVDASGRRIGIGKSLVRTLAWIGDAITCGLPIVGGVMIVSTRGHRRLGDLAAGTFVVRRADVGAPLHVAGAASVPTWTGAPTWTEPAPGPLATDGLPLDRPIWDEARDTYIQFDQSAQVWVRWDAEAGRWQPLEPPTP